MNIFCIFKLLIKLLNASLLNKEGIKEIKFLTICKVVDFDRNNEDDKSNKSSNDIL